LFSWSSQCFVQMLLRPPAEILLFPLTAPIPILFKVHPRVPPQTYTSSFGNQKAFVNPFQPRPRVRTLSYYEDYSIRLSPFSISDSPPVGSFTFANRSVRMPLSGYNFSLSVQFVNGGRSLPRSSFLPPRSGGHFLFQLLGERRSSSLLSRQTAYHRQNSLKLWI